MDASKPWKNVNLRDLYNCPWFFGQLSEENATEILTEALQKDGNLGVKIILFLKTVNMPSGENQFTLVSGHTWQHDVNGKPKGQLISKCLFGVIVWTKKQRDFFQDFCPSL